MSILTIIVKSYSSIFFAILGVAILFLSIGFYLIVRLTGKKATSPILKEGHKDKPVAKRKSTSKAHSKSDSGVASASDIRAIAGDDPMSTQLDLARAYIESGKKQLAKIILETVAEEGGDSHQEEAQRLLSNL